MFTLVANVPDTAGHKPTVGRPTGSSGNAEMPRIFASLISPDVQMELAPTGPAPGLPARLTGGDVQVEQSGSDLPAQISGEITVPAPVFGPTTSDGAPSDLRSAPPASLQHESKQMVTSLPRTPLAGMRMELAAAPQPARNAELPALMHPTEPLQPKLASPVPQQETAGNPQKAATPANSDALNLTGTHPLRQPTVQVEREFPGTAAKPRLAPVGEFSLSSATRETAASLKIHGGVEAAIAPALPGTAATPSEQVHREVQPFKAVPAEVSEQIRSAVLSRTEGQRVEVRLDPPELGRVHIDFDMSKSGSVKAVIGAVEPETLDLLKRNISTLIEDLKEQGIDHVDLQWSQEKTGERKLPTAMTRASSDPVDHHEATRSNTSLPNNLSTGLNLTL